MQVGRHVGHELFSAEGDVAATAGINHREQVHIKAMAVPKRRGLGMSENLPHLLRGNPNVGGPCPNCGIGPNANGYNGDRTVRTGAPGPIKQHLVKRDFFQTGRVFHNDVGGNQLGTQGAGSLPWVWEPAGWPERRWRASSICCWTGARAGSDEDGSSRPVTAERAMWEEMLMARET